MKKISILSIIMATGLFVHNAKSINHRAVAFVFTPLTIESTSNLFFGAIISGTTAGTVTITEDSATTSGGVTFADGGTGHAGTIEIHGSPTTDDFSSIVQIVHTPPAQLVMTEDSSKTMSLSNMQLLGTFSLGDMGMPTDIITSIGYTGNELMVGLDENGEATLTTTGTLNVGANQTPGQYEGIWTINVIYPGTMYNAMNSYP